jgi:ketosteroid isomerase-like protein
MSFAASDRSMPDVLRRQGDGTWRFVIDNPWGTD